MSKINLYSEKVKVESFDLPKGFVDKINLPLLAQAMRVYTSNSHQKTSRVKTRGEVRISTRKIYRQKGTGHARHGAKSAPIFVGGGVAHGPKGLKKILVLSKKLRKLALKSAMSFMISKGKLAVVEIVQDIKKTSIAAKILNKIRENEKVNKITVVFSKLNNEQIKYFRNIKDIRLVNFESLNVGDLLNANFVVFDKKIFPEKVSSAKKKVKTNKTVKNNRK